MTDAPCHIIHSTRFDVVLSRDMDALKAPHRLGDFFHRTVQPALDQALTRHGDNDRDYRIDRLVIDLGPIDMLHPDLAIAETISRCIARALQDLEPQQIQPARTQQRIHESFLIFLRTGQIPWFGAEMAIADLEKTIRGSAETDLVRLLASLRPLLRHAGVRRRLTQQCSLSFVEWLAETMQPHLRHVFLETTAGFDPELAASDKAEILLRVAARFPKGISKALLQKGALGQVAEFFESKQDRKWMEDRPHLSETEAVTEGHDRDEEPAEGEDSFFVPQAGVVLLHPFLPRFLERRGLLDAGRYFKNARCREKAIHLLHFLATGREHPEEPQTGIYKILCGLDIAVPVPKILELDPEDRNETSRLLESVIEHWSRLKNTSPEGLRTAFLQRQGKLTRTNDGWHLTVEQQSIDILLGTLPWILSTIRLPWLQEPLRVDWA